MIPSSPEYLVQLSPDLPAPTSIATRLDSSCFPIVVFEAFTAFPIAVTIAFNIANITDINANCQ